GDDLAHADQLQRDVGHGSENSGNRNGDRKPPALVAAAHIVRQRYVTVSMAYPPERRQHQHHERIAHDAVGNSKEANCAGPEQRGRNSNDGVGRVQVSTDQEPGDQGADLAPRQAPLIETWSIEIRSPPAYSPEPG